MTGLIHISSKLKPQCAESRAMRLPGLEVTNAGDKRLTRVSSCLLR